MVGGRFTRGIDLTGTDIGNALILYDTSNGKERSVVISKDSKFVLSNANVGIIEDAEASWCEEASCESGNLVKTEITNFKYESGDGLVVGNNTSFTDRSVDWLLQWIKSGENKDGRFNPKPYIQLALVVRESGDPVKADKILYEMQNHEATSTNTPLLRKVFLWLKWALIGYGYENWRALLPLSLLIAIGAYLCPRLECIDQPSIPERIWFSVDKAIPVIELGACPKEIKAENWIKSYFYIHQAIGFILASFLVAGITGFAN